MSTFVTLLFGPLAAPECSIASRRAWLIWVRILPAFTAGIVAFVALWYWWIRQQLNPYHQPLNELQTALTFIEGMMLVFAFVMTPAVLAGSLAGEKERGSIGLLLTTRVDSLDIVMGRLIGRLSQVAMIELAALPGLLLIAAMMGLSGRSTLTLLVLPASVMFGGGGISMAASVLSRRGRDALLFIYLMDVLFLLSPVVGLLGWKWVGLLSPFESLQPLTRGDLTGSAWLTSGVWVAMGLLGTALASWRLRSSSLAEGDSAKSRKRKRGGRGWVPPIDEARPMLWKELYIEQVGSLGRAGRWIGGLLVAWLILGSVSLASYAAYGYFVDTDSSRSDWATVQTSLWYGNSALFIGFLIQWAIGLRAAVTISSERERGTWDALLTSPLDGLEIVKGKLWGSLFALKWLVIAAVLAWSITLAMGGMFFPEYLEQMIGLVVIGTFMAAAGVRASLRSPTATQSMGITMALWIGYYLMGLALGWIVCIFVAMVCVIGWLMAMRMGLADLNSRPMFPMSYRLGMDLIFYGQFVAWTIAIVIESRLRFDRVAGRMTGGKTAVAIDHLIHGVPMAPVVLDAKPYNNPALTEATT